MTVHQVVLASAGTGKTFQLTNRFIGLLASGAEASSILATTFTRKAAGEVLQRILSRLAAAAVEEKALAELQQHIDLSLTHERCQQLTAQLASGIHRLNVKTLDSFFGWVTGCFGLEMGIAPGWRIISDEEDAELRDRAIQEALREADREQLVAFMEMLHGGGNGRTVHEAISSAVNAAYAAYVETRGRPQAWTVFGPEYDPLSAEALARAIASALGLVMPVNRTGATDQRWQKAHDRNMAAAQAGDWTMFLSSGLASCIARGQFEYYRQPMPEAVIAAYTPLVEHASAMILHEFLGRNMATRELMARFDGVYQRLKDQAGAWRFEDVPRRLLAHPLDGQLEHLYYRLDARIRHIMLDEFQDTSLEQFGLVEPIIDELLSHGAEAGEDAGAVAGIQNSVFIVGDVKQSLYSWRGAEPELLPNLVNRWSHLQQATLDMNYRSSPVILETVNGVFERLTENPAIAEYPEIAQRWQDGYRTHRAAKGKLAGTASLLMAPSAGDGASKADQAMATLAFAAARVKAIVERQPQAVVGVLVRTNRWIPQIIFNLHELGIAASEEGGNPLTDSPPVAAAVSLLQLADHPGDTAALYHVSTSPLGPVVGLPDPFDVRRARRIGAAVRQRVMHDGYAAYLRWLRHRCAASMDARGFARFEQLIDLAQQFDAEAGTRPSAFVRIVQERGIQEPGRHNVSVMTIHQAKGLEFDAVILPELDRRWSLKNDQVLTDRRDERGERTPFAPVTAVTRYPSSAVCALHDELAELHRHWQERQIGEELCCLYVALTRAVHVLEMIVPPPKPSESKLPLCAAGVLRGALGEGGPASLGGCNAGTAAGESAGCLIWERRSGPDDEWAAQVMAERVCASAARAEPEAVELALAAPVQVPTGRLRRRTPSSLEGGDVVDLGRIWSHSGDAARDRGLLIHAWFESFEWLEDGLPVDGELLDIAPGLGFQDGAARDLLESFRNSVESGGEIAAALQRKAYASRDAERLEVRREWSFAVRDADPGSGRVSLLSGIFDRVVIGFCEGRPAWADIVDFKTDRIAAGDAEALSKSVEIYRPQIRAYRRAAGALLSLPQERVTARLLFTHMGIVVEIE